MQDSPSPGGSVSGSGIVTGRQTVVDSRHRLHQPASIGGPRLSEPQWMPADEGRLNDPQQISPRKFLVQRPLFRAHIQRGTSQRF